MFRLCSNASSVSGRRRRAVALASVRRPNCTYNFPVCSFNEDSDVPRCKRRNQPDQVHKPILPVQRRDGKLLPPTITPTLKSMRPDPPHDPAVELVEEHSDVGSFVILAHPRRSGFSSAISSLVCSGTLRLLRC